MKKGAPHAGLYAAVACAVIAALVLVANADGLSLPGLFMALAAVMMVLALSALLQSLRHAFGGTADALVSSLPERAALVDEKNALLRAIKDIAFEREVGKLSEEDFARLDRAYRLRAKEVLKKLDEDIEPFLARAEGILRQQQQGENTPPNKKKKTKKKHKRAATKPAAAKRRECARCGTRNPADAAWCKECRASLLPLVCSVCDAENDPDAKFCIKCASTLQAVVDDRAVKSEEEST